LDSGTNSSLGLAKTIGDKEMKYMYALLLVLAGSPALASVYATAAAADEGIRRGASEPFTRGVGWLDLQIGGKTLHANGILIAPNKLLTVKHALLSYKIDSAAVIFHPDIIEFNTHCHERPREPFYGKPVSHIASRLKLDSIVNHPSLDFSMITLMQDLPGVARAPLLLENPKEPTMSGFLTSYSPVHALGIEESVHEGARHISILKNVTEGKRISDGGTHWMKFWDIPAGVDATDPTNRIFTPLAEDHRLTAYSQQSDSGAPFVVKMGADYKIAGLYRGKEILPCAPEDCVGDKMKYVAVSSITPLYLAADWIRENS
jgi:hypothetical protein